MTDRDRVVAELVAPQSGTAELSGDALLAEAVRSGWLKPPVLPASGPPPRGKPLMTLEELLRDLDESRADRT